MTTAANGGGDGRPATVTTVAEQDAPDSAWNRAAMAVEHGDPLCCRTEWQLSAMETMHPSFRPEIVVADGAALAFAWADTVRYGLTLLPCEASWCFGCPLLGDGAIDLLQRRLARLQERGVRPAVFVTGMAPGSATLARLESAMADRWRLQADEERVQCVASLAGGLDGFLSRRTQHFRRRVEQAWRRARDLGVVFERCAPTDAIAARAAYARMCAIEERSWKGIGDCGMTTGASLPFYGRMCERLAVGGFARAIFAVHEGRDVGFIFGGCVDGIYRGQQFSFDQSWARHSLGNVLQLEQIAWLGEEQARRYDMGPLMDYKLRWAETQVALQARLLLPA